MNRTSKSIAAFTVLAAIAIGLGLYLGWRGHTPDELARVAAAGVPVVMHTAGGRLEVATVTVVEAFKLADPREVLGIDLGTTVSHVQVTAVYRYHIEMAREWPVRLTANTVIVEAGEIKPQLPVAFDTSTMQKHTDSGWARFNKQDNLDKLERSISPLLAARAAGYRQLARETARKSVADFVSKWLLRYYAMDPTKTPVVMVRFPDETAISVPRT